MADSEAFVMVCELLERETFFDRLEARGTVRLVLKEAGLDARGVTPPQMDAVVERILPGALVARGVDGSEGLCRRWRSQLETLHHTSSTQAPEAVFARLGGAGAA